MCSTLQWYCFFHICLPCISECGKTLQNPSGAFSSPDYGNSSPPPEGEHCEWRITATQGERIILNITEIDLYKSESCDTDYLEVRDGYWYKSTLLGKYKPCDCYIYTFVID